MTEDLITLRNHYILCGIGRTGRQIAQEFVNADLPLVVIEQDHEAIDQLQNQSGSPILHIIGDATDDETLEAAGIRQAIGLMTTLKDDKDNVFVVLTARSLNPTLRIVARVNDVQENAPKLRKAGADSITSPHVIGGMRMASQMIRPEVVQFLNSMLDSSQKGKTLHFAELQIEEIAALPAAQAQLSLADVGRYTGLLVLAIRRGEQYLYKPGGDIALQRRTSTQEGDILVVVGTQAALEKAMEQVSA